MYSPLAGSGGRSGRDSTVLVINGTPVPAVPGGSCLLLLAGLVMWSVGMLQARSTVNSIFSDLGLEVDSLNQLKATVLAGVLVMLVLSLAVSAANAWLEAVRLTGTKTAGPIPALQAYRLHSSRVNVANWCLLLAAALALAGSITWLTTMSTALSATQQTPGFGQLVNGSSSGKWNALASFLGESSTGGSSATLPKPPAITAPPAEAAEAVVGIRGASGEAATAGAGAAGQADVGQLWAVSTCPPGCVDLGLIAEVLGLPWPCFCQVWLLGDLVEQLHKVVTQLWVAVVGGLLLFAAVSWLYGYLAAQGAYAECDLQAAALAAGEGGPSGAGEGSL